MTGSLQVKKNYYYIVLNIKDNNGNTRQKWISTRLPEKNNKRKAELLLRDTIKEYESKYTTFTKNIEFSDFMLEWLEIIKPQVKPNTYAAYSTIVKNKVVPYFKSKKISLQDLQPMHIQKFYSKKSAEGLSGNTIKHYHANIHKALEYALKQNWIPYNPASRVELPKIKIFDGNFYDEDQIKNLINLAKGTTIEIPILLASVYGLRRSEILALKWDVVDFKNHTITIKRTLVPNKGGIIFDDSTKNSSSRRSLKMLPQVEERLLQHRETQVANMLFFDSGYQDNNFICTMPDGNVIKPDYVSRTFKKLLNKNNMPIIRFHDLRHSSASLLLANGFGLKEVSNWLGHSSITTTNRYAHLIAKTTENMSRSVEQSLF
ncbi:MAG TPA: site-specific integrase [Clostridiales bacterium]|nr:site-specific integrase [Lachnospiraceae bacterium]HAQ40802.1 site-specific integrase [Clostridiales bacterium]